jgi:hypothetical protein
MFEQEDTIHWIFDYHLMNLMDHEKMEENRYDRLVQEDHEVYQQQ